MSKTVSQIWQAHLCINYAGTGISETYWLRADSWPLARIDALTLATVRSWLLGEGATIEWLDVRQPTYPAPSWPLLQDPIGCLRHSNGNAYWEAPDSAHTGLNIIWNPIGKKSFWRRLWYLPDSEVHNSAWVRRGLQVPRATPAFPITPAALTPAELYQVALGTIRDLTCLGIQRDTVPGDPELWDVFDWRPPTFGGVGSTQPRPAFERYSWEAAENDRCPAFSPCGCPVGASRATAETACIWYPNGETYAIRFFRSKPGAKILPFPTIFWDWRGHEDIENADKPGVLTNKTEYVWTWGGSVGDAPGLKPTGTPADFLGQSVLPYDDTADTPLDLRPACDMPIRKPFRIDNSDGSVIELDAERLTVKIPGLKITKPAAKHIILEIDDEFETPEVDATVWRGFRDINFWRARNAYPLNRAYFAGVNTNTNQGNFTPAGNTIYALPLMTPGGALIDSILCQVMVAASAGNLLRLGIYSSISQSNIYPGPLVFDSGDLPADVTGIQGYATALNLHPAKLHWLVLNTSTGGTPAELAGQWDIDFYPLLGVPATDLSESAAYGIAAASVYGGFPDPFPPAEAVTLLLGGGFSYVPKLAVHYVGSAIVLGGGV